MIDIAETAEEIKNVKAKIEEYEATLKQGGLNDADKTFYRGQLTILGIRVNDLQKKQQSYVDTSKILQERINILLTNSKIGNKNIWKRFSIEK